MMGVIDMDARTFRAALTSLDMRQVELADLFEVADRTVRHYAEEGVTNMPTIILIRLLVRGKITRQDIEEVKG